MTHNGLSNLLKRATAMVEASPTPDAEVDPEVAEAVVETVTEAVKPVVVAIRNAEDEAEDHAEEDDTDVSPPEALVSKPAKVEGNDPTGEKPKDKYLPTDPEADASYRSKRMLTAIGRVRNANRDLVAIRMLAKDGTPERDAIDATWDAGLVHEAINTLLREDTYTHPDGWKVYPNRTKVRAINAGKKAS